MAGNLDAGRVLSVIAEYGIRSFGVLGVQVVECDDDGRYTWPEHDAWQLTEIVFTEQALAHLKAHFAKNGFQQFRY